MFFPKKESFLPNIKNPEKYREISRASNKLLKIVLAAVVLIISSGKSPGFKDKNKSFRVEEFYQDFNIQVFKDTLIGFGKNLAYKTSEALIVEKEEMKRVDMIKLKGLLESYPLKLLNSVKISQIFIVDSLEMNGEAFGGLCYRDGRIILNTGLKNFDHEFYHRIELYLGGGTDKGWEKRDKEWEEKFYGKSQSPYVGEKYDSLGSYEGFITHYAAKSAREDKAEIWEYLRKGGDIYKDYPKDFLLQRKCEYSLTEYENLVKSLDEVP